MSNSHDYSGTTHSVPETAERKWGNAVTSLLGDLTDGLDGISYLQATGILLLTLDSAARAAYGAAGEITPTASVISVAGDGAARTLDTTTAITDGTKAGQILILLGYDSTNTLTIPNVANTLMNGPCTLPAYGCLVLIWDESNTGQEIWRELFRNV